MAPLVSDICLGGRSDIEPTGPPDHPISGQRCCGKLAT